MGALGVDLDEGLEFVSLADDLVDLWDVTVGSIADWSLDSGPSRFFAEGWQLAVTGRVREATTKPIVGVGRLTDPDLMASIIRSGAWDLIGAARPSIADPFLPGEDPSRGASMRSASASAATSASRRPTAAATSAARRTRPPARSTAAAGIPSTCRRWPSRCTRWWWAPGPAGMECAITLARRGARVDLVERAPITGGLVGWITRLPGMGEWGRLVAYRMVQLKRLPGSTLDHRPGA